MDRRGGLLLLAAVPLGILVRGAVQTAPPVAADPVQIKRNPDLGRSRINRHATVARGTREIQGWRLPPTAPQGGFRLSQLLLRYPLSVDHDPDGRVDPAGHGDLVADQPTPHRTWLLWARNSTSIFLGQPAQYDINQRLIEYDSQRTPRAARRSSGCSTPILVAIIGCIAADDHPAPSRACCACSKNWIVSRLMAIYVEGFPPTCPLLLWIVLIFRRGERKVSPIRGIFRTGGGGRDGCCSIQTAFDPSGGGGGGGGLFTAGRGLQRLHA